MKDGDKDDDAMKDSITATATTTTQTTKQQRNSDNADDPGTYNDDLENDGTEQQTSHKVIWPNNNRPALL